MEWTIPPRIKIYEALGALADQRLELVTEFQARIKSSSGNKAYDVIFDPSTQTISSNDNGSYWQGYLGYPAIAYLMKKRLLPFDAKLSEKLKDIHWKAINQQFKNDFSQTEAYLYTFAPKAELINFSVKVLKSISNLHLQKPSKRSRPPSRW